MDSDVNSLDANKLKAVAGLDRMMEKTTKGSKGQNQEVQEHGERD
jgi:hypothetical protein